MDALEPARRIRRATRLREQRVPVKRISAWIRGTRYVPRLSRWKSLIRSSLLSITNRARDLCVYPFNGHQGGGDYHDPVQLEFAARLVK